MRDYPLELRDIAKIKRGKRNSEPIPLAPNYLHTAHGDIGFGDLVAPGGYKYALLLIDQNIHTTWTHELKAVTGEYLCVAFQDFKIKAGGLPQKKYTVFDQKFLKGECCKYLDEEGVRVTAAPSGRQSQNGLVERAWQMICNMARSYLTDMQIPKHFWF
eukprot:3216399-Ditylum_brightwellii.AAC.1